MSIFKKYPSSSFLRQIPENRPLSGSRLRESIDDLFSYLDGHEDIHFATELDRDYHSRLWEMMVAKILVTSGYDFQSADKGPDFKLNVGMKTVWVEAVCPGNGNPLLPDSVPPLVISTPPMAQHVPAKKMLLRLTNAIAAKKRKFEEYKEIGIVSPSDSCVIAVSSAKLGCAAGMWPSLGIRATLGYSNPYLVFETSVPSGPTITGLSLLECVEKSSGNFVDTAMFLNPENAGIAGLIYSDASPFSLSFDLHRETSFIQNPMASNPIRTGFLSTSEEIWTVRSPEDHIWKAFRLNPANSQI